MFYKITQRPEHERKVLFGRKKSFYCLFVLFVLTKKKEKRLFVFYHCLCDILSVNDEDLKMLKVVQQAEAELSQAQPH